MESEQQATAPQEPLRVFVISPIGGTESPERLRADRFLRYIVKAALQEPAYAVERADQHDSPQAITAAMLDSILESDICVADITGRNPNVFYELAIAHAMDKHVVIMDGDKERSPFDIQDQRAIKYGLMPEEIEAAIVQLRAKAATMNVPSNFKDMMNPVATAFRAWTTQQRVESSGDSTEQLLLRVVERLETKVDRLERRGDDRPNRTSVEFMRSFREAKDLVDALERIIAEGDGSPVAAWLAKAGQRLIDPTRRTNPTLLGLRSFNEDAEYVLEMNTLGLPVNRKDLPSGAGSSGWREAE